MVVDKYPDQEPIVYHVETRHEAFIRAVDLAGRTAVGNQIAEHGESTIEQRQYQSEAWGAIHEARGEGAKAALVHLATGLGKTTVAVMDALRFAGEFFDREGRYPKMAFVVHQNEILDQAAERFAQFAPMLTQGRYADGQKDADKHITFATMQSLHNDLDILDPKTFDYKVYDEAHHAQAETFSEVVRHFTPEFKLAVTATPERMDEERIEDLFGESVYSKPLAEAMTEGYLADVDYHIVFDQAVKQAMDGKFDPKSLKEIRSLLKNESRNEEIAKQIKAEMEKIGLSNAKTIVFCENLDQASEMADLLEGKPYHSGIDKYDRRETLSAFKSNGLQVITTRDMFNEGVDIPDARLLVFLRSTSSKTIFEQQLGRGLRKNSDKQTVSVLDFVANIERLVHVKDLTDQIRTYKDNSPARVSESIPVSEDTELSAASEGLTIHTEHSDFDFDKLSIELLEKIGSFRRIRNDWSHIKTIEDAAALWKNRFGDTEPTARFVAEQSRIGIYLSGSMIYDLGGVNALKVALGYRKDFSHIETIEDAAALWREQFGDEEPTIKVINEAAKSGTFIPVNLLRQLGGVLPLKSACGFAVTERAYDHIKTIEDAAALWREQFGDEIPMNDSIIESSKNNQFISAKKLAKLGGLRALREATGLHLPFEKINTIEDAAALWREQFGDREPTQANIKAASKAGDFISMNIVTRLGGGMALKAALGQRVDYSHVVTIEDAAALWRERFGDEVPTTEKIKLAAREHKFPNITQIRNIGGNEALRKALNIRTHRVEVSTIEDAAALWRERFGDEVPTFNNIAEASKNGLFMSTASLQRIGAIDDLKKACGHSVQVKLKFDSIEDAAQYWLSQIGNTEPNAQAINEASKAGKFVSQSVINRFGGINAFKRACGFDI